ncbi:MULTISPECIES: FAD-dependent monooxygenase [unclassified Burkholderia]|uniref:FAD-dependent monooxygenase n=1 Tax=unclassified Burkholderia TaxID=2613784 RepID=UPI00197CE508|nr:MULTISPECIES: FAD-dependent monooxygenase [unclassified Burkholderia]MBN3768413.1 monooxygenase [Burkholderia sp. Se-20378]MBN3793634.1 monooxygenase [Burkholderia sp. Ac-20392]
MKIDIVGAGPAGMYFALLTKKYNPSNRVTIYEQNPEGATYGWGVVFSDIGLSFLKEADMTFFDEFIAHHERCDYMEIVHRGTHVQVHGNHFSRTSRIDMLRVLQRACEREGIRIEYGRRIEDVHALAADCDMLVAADGGNSSIRTQLADHFRPQFVQRRNKFAWYGTHQLFHPVSLIFRETLLGVFIAHCYQYSSDLSTFLIETDPDTWRRAGLDHASEDESRRFCTDVFRSELGSNVLLTNRSLWFEANIVNTANWHHDNIVLLGDALRTVHFSLGSGTRMAMQDAIALYRAIAATPCDLPAAFAAFEAARRPASFSFLGAAAKSLDWYESVASKLHLDPVSFAYDYMCRTEKVTRDDLRRRDPLFVDAYDTLQARAQ